MMSASLQPLRRALGHRERANESRDSLLRLRVPHPQLVDNVVDHPEDAGDYMIVALQGIVRVNAVRFLWVGQNQLALETSTTHYMRRKVSAQGDGVPDIVGAPDRLRLRPDDDACWPIILELRTELRLWRAVSVGVRCASSENSPDPSNQQSSPKTGPAPL